MVWEGFLRAYAAQEWAQCDKLMAQLRSLRPRCTLYQLYAARVEGLRGLPFNPYWDSATNFDTK